MLASPTPPPGLDPVVGGGKAALTLLGLCGLTMVLRMPCCSSEGLKIEMPILGPLGSVMLLQPHPCFSRVPLHWPLVSVVPEAVSRAVGW